MNGLSKVLIVLLETVSYKDLPLSDIFNRNNPIRIGSGITSHQKIDEIVFKSSAYIQRLFDISVLVSTVRSDPHRPVIE